MKIEITMSKNESTGIIKAIGEGVNTFEPGKVDEACMAETLERLEKSYHHNFMGGSYNWNAADGILTLDLNEEANSERIEFLLKTVKVLEPIYTMGKGFISMVRGISNHVKEAADEFCRKFTEKWGGKKRFATWSFYDVDLHTVAKVMFEDDGLNNEPRIVEIMSRTIEAERLDHEYIRVEAWKAFKKNNLIDGYTYDSREKAHQDMEDGMESMEWDMVGDLGLYEKKTEQPIDSKIDTDKKIDDANCCSCGQKSAPVNIVHADRTNISEKKPSYAVIQGVVTLPCGEKVGIVTLIDMDIKKQLRATYYGTVRKSENEFCDKDAMRSVFEDGNGDMYYFYDDAVKAYEIAQKTFGKVYEKYTRN